MNRITQTSIALLLLPTLVISPGCAGGDPDSQDTHDDQKHDDARDEHDQEHGPQIAQLRPGEMEEFGIEIAEAGRGELRLETVLPGVVEVNPDGLVHITPRVPGVVRDVFKVLGDEVVADELLAVLDSRELAEAKAGFLATRERLELASSIRQREQYLHEREISSEQEYLVARQAEAETRIAVKSAQQRLHALGLAEEEVGRLPEEPDEYLTRYEMRAPIGGTIIEKHITRGEMLREDSLPFVVADLSTVWVVLTVYQKDLVSIRAGQRVRIIAGHDIAEADGTIEYVSPILDEHTRTTTARIVLVNDDQRWRPGLFVTGRVVVEHVQGDVVVPRTAVQTVDNEPVVFVQTTDGFEARPVQLGRADARSVVVAAGLDPGDRYVSHGGFALKAEMSKGASGHAGHSH